MPYRSQETLYLFNILFLYMLNGRSVQTGGNEEYTWHVKIDSLNTTVQITAGHWAQRKLDQDPPKPSPASILVGPVDRRRIAHLTDPRHGQYEGVPEALASY